MAVVMGHGGDVDDEPPHPFGEGFGVHQIDGPERWSATIDHFLIDRHSKRSSVNKECRKKQVIKNCGGTCNYGSACFKNNLNRLEAFHRGHVNKQGDFANPICEIHNVLVVEKVLGARRGHVRGIGPKPSAAGTSASFQWQSQSQAPQPIHVLIKLLKNVVA
ncbi:unnamed protein product [Lactuca saligna]|uniref:Uncharacterized protein n=1 Tax=Lactuca saligna TaxID=75948 RepID=A0AA35ZQJ9_LACSI|nr:unnamed protein product [Lactuca saligna]